MAILFNTEQDPFNADVLAVNKNEDGPDLTILENAPEGSTIIIEPSSTTAIKSGNDEALKNLVNLDVDFKLINEKADKIISLKEVDEQIAGISDIDAARAEVVAESFPGLFDEIPKSGFTKLPTKVNYKEVINFTKTKIAKEEMLLVDMFRTYIGAPYESAVEFLKQIVEVYYPGLKFALDTEIEELTKIHSKIFDSQSGMISYDKNDFIDLTKTNLLKINPNSIRTEFKSIALFHQSVMTVQELFKCQHFIDFFFSTLGRKPELEDLEITIQDLATFAKSDFITCLDQIRDKVIEEAKICSNLASKGFELSSNYSVMTEYVVKNAPSFMSFHKCLGHLGSLICHLNILTLTTSQLLVTYSEL